MSKGACICLVSPGHVSANPRLVKEADALARAGYDVHVVAGRYFAPLDPLDQEILARAEWTSHVVDYAGGSRAISAKAARRLLRSAGGAWTRHSLRWAGLAHHAAVPQLARAARGVPAQLYVGHCLAGLAAAALAAEDTRSLLAFDAEDFHAGESAAALNDAVESALIDRIERVCLPRCQYVTASSAGIARAYVQRYGISEPTVILNVFPRAEAPAAPTAPAAGEIRRLYWFSQTVGPDRGLEPMLRVLAAMNTPCELHLRGIEAPGFKIVLADEANRVGFRGPIVLHRTASAAEMARLATNYDLGLSLELAPPPNRDICLTNKIFTYLLAGIPVVLSPTRAQREIADELGDAAVLVDFENPAASATRLDQLLGDASKSRRARDAAWDLAQTRFNWDLEQPKLLDLIRRALSDAKS